MHAGDLPSEADTYVNVTGTLPVSTKTTHDHDQLRITSVKTQAPLGSNNESQDSNKRQECTSKSI